MTRGGMVLECLKCEAPVKVDPESRLVVCPEGCDEPWTRTTKKERAAHIRKMRKERAALRRGIA